MDTQTNGHAPIVTHDGMTGTWNLRPDDEKIVPTKVVTTDKTQHRVESQHGKKVHVNDTSDVRTVTDETFDSEVRRVIDAKDAERQHLEDTRANRRNRNRLMTLLGAVMIGIGVVWTLPHLGHMGIVLAPYSFIITVLFDSSLTLYAYIRKY